MPRQRPPAVLPAWLWLWFPPLLLLVIFPVRWLDHAAYTAWIDGEQGLIELATPALSFVGVVYGLRLLAALRREQAGLLTLWVGLLTAACFYFAGEELSWGQQLFHWHTPAAIDALNDQHETNLHNMSSWFDQKPRMLLELWVLIGGIVVPLRGFDRLPQLSPPQVWSWFWPTMDCLPTAVLAIAIRMPERLKDAFHWQSLPLEIRYSEPQEYYFALFLTLYLLSLRKRILARRP